MTFLPRNPYTHIYTAYIVRVFSKYHLLQNHIDWFDLISCFIPKGTYPITLGKGYNNIKIIQIVVYIMTEELAKNINVKLIIWNIDFL